MTLRTRLLAVNIAGLALVGGAASQGWITDIWNGDVSRMSSVIFVIFLFGVYLCFRSINRQPIIKTVRWIATALVMLGLIGTVLGFIKALDSLEHTIPDASTAAAIIAKLVSGMGVSLNSTLVGAILNIWLNLNIRVVESHRE